MTSLDSPPLNLVDLYQSLLQKTNPLLTHQYLSPSTTPEPLQAPPPKNSIRFIENDQNQRREKYDGHRWRSVCIWEFDKCTNLAYYSDKLCKKHHAYSLNKVLRSKKRKPLATYASLPAVLHEPVQNESLQNNEKNHSDHDDDDIQIIGEFCPVPTTRESLSNNLKSEVLDFHVFSVDHVDEIESSNTIKGEPTISKISSNNKQIPSDNDIQYISSKTKPTSLNIEEYLSKQLPPLTDFEEEYLATRLIQELPITSRMLDAQFFLHREAIAVVQKNYRIKMDTIAPEYFYDFLLRHPRAALYHSSWFSYCKPVLPTTGSPIDTKMWTLAMIIRGAQTAD